MHIVRGKCRTSQRPKERAHLVGRERVTRLYGRLAGDGGSQPLVPSMRARLAASAEGGERITKALDGIEARVRGGNGMDDERVPAKRFDLVANARQQVGARLEDLGVIGGEVYGDRKEETLRR